MKLYLIISLLSFLLMTTGMPSWEDLLSNIDQEVEEIGKGSLSKSGSKADNKGLSNAAARAFSGSSSNALSRADGRGFRAIKQSPVAPN